MWLKLPAISYRRGENCLARISLAGCGGQPQSREEMQPSGQLIG